MNSVRCPKPPEGVRKRKVAVFRIKVDFLKKVCYKVSLCENFRRQGCKAFTGAQMVGRVCSLLPEILSQIDPPV